MMPEEVIHWKKLTAEEKNKMVAEKVMGWEQSMPYDVYHRYLWKREDAPGLSMDTPPFVQSMDAAWEIIRKLAMLESDNFSDCWRKHEFLAFLGGQSSFKSSIGELLLTVDVLAKWTPEMFCIAALKAVGCTFAEGEGE